MTKQYLKPIALAISVAFALTACGKQESAPTPATTAPAAAATTAAVDSSKSIFDVSELDPKINACADFNGFVNSQWIAANPIPADRTRWGAFDKLAEDSLNTQHKIVEDAAKGADQAAAGSIEQKIGNLYKSGMADAAVDKAGFDPLKPTLAEIDQLKNGKDVASYIGKMFASGERLVFRFGAQADFKHADMQIGYARQSGLGLPTKDYYTDPKQADLRKAYLDYIARTLQLTGVSADDAKQQADAVMALETKLADASLAPVELRVPENQYHFVSVKDADKITPHFSWDNFFKAQGVTIDKGFSLSQPKFFAEFDKLLASAPISQWQAYLRFHAIDNASDALSKNFRDNKFAFYGQTLGGQPEQKPRWKQVLDAVNTSMGMALGELYVKQEFTPEAKSRAEALVTNVRNALKARIENLDWMSAETKTKAIAKWDTFLPKIGYPDKWRDWTGLTVVPDNFYANVKAASKFNYDYDLAKIGQPTDRKEWGMTPQTVNAYYSPTENTMPATASTTRAASSTVPATTPIGGPRTTVRSSTRVPPSWCSSSTTTRRSRTSRTHTSTAS